MSIDFTVDVYNVDKSFILEEYLYRYIGVNITLNDIIIYPSSTDVFRNRFQYMLKDAFGCGRRWCSYTDSECSQIMKNFIRVIVKESCTRKNLKRVEKELYGRRPRTIFLYNFLEIPDDFLKFVFSYFNPQQTRIILVAINNEKLKKFSDLVERFNELAKDGLSIEESEVYLGLAEENNMIEALTFYKNYWLFQLTYKVLVHQVPTLDSLPPWKEK